MRKLAEQKAAVESANEELKRQNQYWQDLFKNQQLTQTQSGDPTRSNISNNSIKGTDDSAADLSYDSLDLSRGDVMKRSKRSDSGHYDELSLMEKQDTLSDRYAMNHDASSMHRNLSFHQNSFEPRQLPKYRGFNADADDEINVDDFLLERKQEDNYGKFHFFGLALVFGAVGTVSSFGGLD